MPSVEIVCIGQTKISKFSGLPFRLFAEKRLVSHRSPQPLFQSEFDALEGCIYHLCNPKRGYTAYELLSMSDRDWPKREGRPGSWALADELSFLPIHVPFVRTIVAELLQASPVGKILFTSDYQFGPHVRRYKRPLTQEKFWELHAARKLHLNALYPLHLGSRRQIEPVQVKSGK